MAGEERQADRQADRYIREDKTRFAESTTSHVIGGSKRS